jgi:heme-degrading monooxygenase HmoA
VGDRVVLEFEYLTDIRARLNPLRYDGLSRDSWGIMFVVIWKFEIAEDQVAGFEAAYGPEGAWAQLFRTSPNYKGTELLRDAYVPGSYLTIDRWTSEEAFRAFRKEHDTDYETLDRQCDALTSRETRVGAYTA